MGHAGDVVDAQTRTGSRIHSSQAETAESSIAGDQDGIALWEANRGVAGKLVQGALRSEWKHGAEASARGLLVRYVRNQ
jgi:hypothetical protein